MATTTAYPQYSAPVGGNFASSLSNLGWLQQMCESTSATSPSESISTIAEGDYMMGGLIAAGNTSTSTSPTTSPTRNSTSTTARSFPTMALKPEPLVQTVPDLDDDEDAVGTAVDNVVNMIVRTPWDDYTHTDLDASSTAAYPIKAVRIDPLGSSHTHLFNMSIGDTGSNTSSNNSSFNSSSVPAHHHNHHNQHHHHQQQHAAGAGAAAAADPFASLSYGHGHGNILSCTEDDSDDNDGENNDSDEDEDEHGNASTGGMDMDMDEDEEVDYRNSAETNTLRADAIRAVASLVRRQQQNGGAAAGASASTASASSASSSSSSSSSKSPFTSASASKAAAIQKKQLAKQQKAAAAIAAAKARTGPPPAIPTSRDIAAFDPAKVVAIGGGPADPVLHAHAHNDTTRPPYSYTAIIYRAVDALGKKRVQLGEIYYQIMLSWAYYAARPLETGWKNSIRHNLTVCRCFKKVARAEGESGKGGYWTIDEPFAKIDIQLDPRDASPRLSKKKIKKKAKSRTMADRKEKPLAFSPSSPQVSRRSLPMLSTVMLEAAAATAAAVAAELRAESASASTSSSSSSSSSSSGHESVGGSGVTAATPAFATPRSLRNRGASRAATAAAAAAAAVAAAAATPETVYPTHLLAHSFEEEVTDFTPREHDDAGNPLPAIPRGPGHTTRVMLPATELVDDSFSALAGMSLNLSTSSFGNALLGSSLGGSNVLNSSFSNLLAGGQLVD